MLSGAGTVRTGFAGPVVSASSGTSFTVATVDASGMDSGRKRCVDRNAGPPDLRLGSLGLPITTSRLIPNSQVTFTFRHAGVFEQYLHHSYSIQQSCYHKVNFGSRCQEVRHNLHVPIPLLPVGHVGRVRKLNPLHFLEFIEEGLKAVIVNLVVFSVGQQCPVRDLGDAVDD